MNVLSNGAEFPNYYMYMYIAVEFEYCKSGGFCSSIVLESLISPQICDRDQLSSYRATTALTGLCSVSESRHTSYTYNCTTTSVVDPNGDE